MLAEFININRLPSSFKAVAEHVYIPLAERINLQKDKQEKPFFVGINGCQGSGKSTFSDFLVAYLSTMHGLKVVSMSLDDFYLSTSAREALAVQIHPLFSTRGVPGTHDIECLERVLSDLKQSITPCVIPKFNKALDEPFPQKAWQHIKEPSDVVLVEGWCWGIPAQAEEQLNTPVNALEKSLDTDKTWRTHVNNQIKSAYQPLYQLMDYWVAIQAPSFNCVHQWRLEQEQKLAISISEPERSKLMNSAQVLEFIQFFQRLTEHGMNTLPNSADATLLLDDNRNISRALFKG